jgi:hypothetical protein
MDWEKNLVLSVMSKQKVSETQQIRLIFNGAEYSTNVPLGISGILRCVHSLLPPAERRCW